MDTATKPIVTTTSLSLLLHAAAIAAALLVYEKLAALDEAVTHGVEVQLISSVIVSGQLPAEVPQAQQMKPVSLPQQLMRTAEKTFAEDILTSLKSSTAVARNDEVEQTDSDRDEQPADARRVQLQAYQDESPASALQSTEASQQHTILELLHRRISDNKEYPYLARRHRREGVATVAFILHPDGSIENAHLVASSHARALDRAALSAVEQIEPFDAAKEYLERAETFQVDIEFDLL
ncbi:MAG: energy transducer TonB [Gammaproteobacteria bacterium]|nr:energy transducer TonB [Gammaproteobacteria bacterium]NNJ49593.1 energy transducer TonB [Gammaproteobacteria bacterium]